MSSIAVITKDTRWPSNKNDVETLIIDITADSGDGGIEDIPIDADLYGIRNHFLYSVETIPGLTPLTADCDITIDDEAGLDIANGQLANRSESVPQLVNIGAGDFGYPIIHGDLNIEISGNAVNAGQVQLILKFTGK